MPAPVAATPRALPPAAEAFLYVDGVRHEGVLGWFDVSIRQVGFIRPDGKPVLLAGRLHRAEDEPAVQDAQGSRWWFREGVLHRVGDRPAIVRADGTCRWYIHG